MAFIKAEENKNFEEISKNIVYDIKYRCRNGKLWGAIQTMQKRDESKTEVEKLRKNPFRNQKIAP